MQRTPNPLDNGAAEQETCRQTTKYIYSGTLISTRNLDSAQYQGVNQMARALTSLPDGRLVVGGDFTMAGRTMVQHVALWDPAAMDWYAMADGLPDPVYELVSTPSGSLYALTNQKTARSATPSKYTLFQWINGNWKIISGPFTGAPDSNIIDSMVWDGQDGFYIGGRFTAAAGLAVNGIIQWDGKTWKALTNTLPIRGIFSVNTLAIGPDGQLYAGGALVTGPDEQTDWVFAWDGQTWKEIGRPMPGPVESLAFSTTGQLVALVGKSTFDGKWSSIPLEFVSSFKEWLPITSGLPLISGGFLIPKGSNSRVLTFYPANIGQSANEIAAWEGSRWQAWFDPDRWDKYHEPQVRAVVANGKVYVLGQFSLMGRMSTDNITAWDGKEWNSLALPDKMDGGIKGQINDLVIDQNGVVTVAGKFNSAGYIKANNIVRWDTKAWQALGDGTNGPINALALDLNGRIFVAGNFSQAGGKAALGLAEWDPSTKGWLSLPAPDLEEITVLAADSKGDLHAAGPFEKGYKVTAWNGSQWKDLPGLFDKEIKALHIDPTGNLYVGGFFSSLSTGETAQALVRWNAQPGTWTNLGMSLGQNSIDKNSVEQILDGPNGSLYIGGNFKSAYGKPLCNLAQLTTTNGVITWNPYISGLPSFNRMALRSDGRLFVITTLPGQDGKADVQALITPRGRDEWAVLDGDGIIGQVYPDQILRSFVVSPSGLLYFGFSSDQAGSQTHSPFAIFEPTGVNF
jgi:trimeric autotransporter adhesin